MINVSKSEMNKAISYMRDKIDSADLSQGGRLSRPELKQAIGVGTASLNKVFAYRANVETFGQGASASSVDVEGMKYSLGVLAKTNRKLADTVGNKDGRIQGSELSLKAFGEANKALVRLTHALKLAGEI